MGEIRIILQGAPYNEPRYYGMIQWTATDVYIRHIGGWKDSRHRDGKTFLHSTGSERTIEQRLPISEISRELINYVDLPPFFPEPPPFEGSIRKNDLIMPTSSAGSAPRLAVEIVEDARITGVQQAWVSHSTAPDVQVCIDKGSGHHLIVAVSGSLSAPPSTDHD